MYEYEQKAYDAGVDACDKWRYTSGFDECKNALKISKESFLEAISAQTAILEAPYNAGTPEWMAFLSGFSKELSDSLQVVQDMKTFLAEIGPHTFTEEDFANYLRKLHPDLFPS